MVVELEFVSESLLLRHKLELRHNIPTIHTIDRIASALLCYVVLLESLNQIIKPRCINEL